MAYPSSYDGPMDPNAGKPMTPGVPKRPPGFKPPRVHSSTGRHANPSVLAQNWGRNTRVILESGDAFDQPSPSMAAASAQKSAHFARKAIKRRGHGGGGGDVQVRSYTRSKPSR